MAFTPKPDKKKKIIEDQEREITDLTKKLADTQEKLLRKITPTSTDQRISRRNLLKRAGWGAIGLTTVGVVSYAFYNAISQPTQSVPSQLPQTTYVTTTEQKTVTESPTMIDPNNPETWPLRNSLQDLKDALQQQGSRSQYVLPEVQKMPGYVNNLHFDNDPKYFCTLTRDEVKRLWSNHSEQDYDYVMQHDPQLYLFYVTDASDSPFRNTNGMIKYGRDANGNGFESYLEDFCHILWALDPFDLTDLVFFRTASGSLHLIYEPTQTQ
jgi:hypothetical protein